MWNLEWDMLGRLSREFEEEMVGCYNKNILYLLWNSYIIKYYRKEKIKENKEKWENTEACMFGRDFIKSKDTWTYILIFKIFKCKIEGKLANVFHLVIMRNYWFSIIIKESVKKNNTYVLTIAKNPTQTLGFLTFIIFREVSLSNSF